MVECGCFASRPCFFMMEAGIVQRTGANGCVSQGKGLEDSGGTPASSAGPKSAKEPEKGLLWIQFWSPLESEEKEFFFFNILNPPGILNYHSRKERGEFRNGFNPGTEIATWTLELQTHSRRSWSPNIPALGGFCGCAGQVGSREEAERLKAIFLEQVHSSLFVPFLWLVCSCVPFVGGTLGNSGASTLTRLRPGR